MGYKGRMTGHGFRGVASTALNEMGYRPDVIEAQLAHVEENRVRAAYNHAGLQDLANRPCCGFDPLAGCVVRHSATRRLSSCNGCDSDQPARK